MQQQREWTVDRNNNCTIRSGRCDSRIYKRAFMIVSISLVMQYITLKHKDGEMCQMFN